MVSNLTLPISVQLTLQRAGHQRGGKGVPTDRGPRLKLEDYAKILDYLEIPENFAAVHGADRKLRPGCRFQSKKSAFTKMAAVLAQWNFPEMDGANLQKRFNRYEDMFRKALAVKNQTGGGVTEEELQAGVTLEVKLKKMCPHFERMLALYGERQNVVPPCVLNHGFADSGLVILDDGQESQVQGNDNVREEPGSPVQDVPHTDGDAFHSPVTTSEADDARQTSDANDVGVVASEPHHGNVPSQANVTPQIRVKAGSGANEHAGKPKAMTSPEDRTAISKANLAATYATRCKEKIEFRMQLIGCKEKWKQAELEEKRLDRLAALKRDRLERQHRFKMERFSSSQAEKRQRQDQQHQILMAHMMMRTQLLSELFRSNKSEEEIGRLMKLVPDGSANSCDGASDEHDTFTSEF